MYPFLRSFTYRCAPGQFLLLNKFGVHGMNYNTNHFASYQSLRNLHPDHEFFDDAQRWDAYKRLAAADHLKNYFSHGRCTLQLWAISHRPVYFHRPLDIIVDGKVLATVEDGLINGHHLVREELVHPGYYFFKPLDCNMPFSYFHPGDWKHEHLIETGKCTKVSVVFSEHDKPRMFVTQTENSNPLDPMVI